MFTKRILIIILALSTQLSFSQKAQRMAYIDMAFVLEKIPEYIQAQNQLDTKVKSWQKRLDRESDDIETLKKDLSNEKPLLTPELIQESEDDIYFKEKDYHKLQEAYFGPKGDLYLYRKLLVQPIQDKVYNAIQEIALKKHYDFVVDKSSDLILLYTNARFDISDLVVNTIVRAQRKAALLAKRVRINKRNKRNNKKFTKSPIKKVALSTNQPKDSILSNANKSNTKVLKDTPANAVLKRIEARNAKRKLLLEKIRLANEARAKKQAANLSAREKLRAERIKLIDKNKKELIYKRDSANQAKKEKLEKKDN